MSWLQRALTPLAMAAGFEPRRDAFGNGWWSAAGVAALSGQAVTCETGLQHWAVQAVLEALASPVSSLPMGVFERLGGDKRRPAPEHPLHSILHSGSGRQTAQLFRDEQARHLAWWRNAYALILPAQDGGPVGGLEQIHPSRVSRVERGSDGWVYYWVRRLAPSVGEDVYREDMIWHVRKAPLTSDGLRGIPVWETARETIGKALAVEQFGALYFANGGSGGGVLEHPGTFKDKADEQKFLDSWRSGGSGLNRHRDRLLTHGVKYSPFTVKNDEAQFLETKKQAGYEIAGLWNMPPHRVGMLERATNNNIEQQSIEFVVYTLGPWIAAIEQAAERDLLVGSDRARFYVEFNVAGLLRGDIKTRYAAYFQARQGGWLSINDIRRLENMDPVGPEGDDYTPLAKSPEPKGSGGAEETADA